MTDTMKTELRREAFERAMCERGYHDFRWYPMQEKFVNIFTQGQWEGWCAALDSQAAQAQPTLGWCEHCGEGVTDFCRGKQQVACARGLPRVNPGDLTKLNELAQVHANNYASPHHFTMSVEGLRNLIGALAAETPIRKSALFELRERVPATVALERIKAAANPFADGEHLQGDAKLVYQQCVVIADMAESLASVNREFAQLIVASPDFLPLEVTGPGTAATMELLGDILNGMDAVTDEDDWMAPVFEAAHARWPKVIAGVQPSEQQRKEK